MGSGPTRRYGNKFLPSGAAPSRPASDWARAQSCWGSAANRHLGPVDIWGRDEDTLGPGPRCPVPVVNRAQKNFRVLGVSPSRPGPRWGAGPLVVMAINFLPSGPAPSGPASDWARAQSCWGRQLIGIWARWTTGADSKRRLGPGPDVRSQSSTWPIRFLSVRGKPF